MSEITQFNTMLAEDQPAGIKLAEAPISQSEQDRQTIEDSLRSIDSDHPAVPILKALLTGENIDGMIDSILPDNTGVTPDLAQFLAKYFHDSLLLSLKNGAGFDAALERAVDMTQSVADTWTDSNIAASDIMDQADSMSEDNISESVSKAEELSADSKDFQEALQKLYMTDKIEIGTEPETEPEFIPEGLVEESLTENEPKDEAALSAGLSDDYLEKVLSTLIPGLEPESVQEDKHGAFAEESFIVESAEPESLSLEAFKDGEVGLESMSESGITTDMGYEAPDTVITPTQASYAPSLNPQTLYYDLDINQSDDTTGLDSDDGVSTQDDASPYSSSASSADDQSSTPASPASYDPEFSLQTGDEDSTTINLVQNPSQGVVSVFAYPNLNGDDKIGDTVDNETKNVVSIVREMIDGYTVNTDITNFNNNFTTNLSNSDVFFMADLAGSEVGSAQNGAEIDYPESSKLALQDWVNDGGTFIISGSDNGPHNNLYTAVDFLNDTFNWDLEFVDVNPQHEDAAWEFNDAASGTSFDYDGAPSLVSFEHTTTTVGAGSVASFIPIYGDADDAAVAVIPYGSGEVIFIGYDYNNAGFKDSGIEGVDYDTDVETGVHSDTAWVQDIIPSSFSYSQLQTESGTISLEDQNQEDTVSISVTSVTCEGNTGSFSLTNDSRLMEWFKLSGGLDTEATNGKVHWTFIAGESTNDFNHLNSGGDMEITYNIQATDDSTDTATADYSITVTLSGSNDTNSIVVDSSGSGENLITATAANEESGEVSGEESGHFIEEPLLYAINDIISHTTDSESTVGQNIFVQELSAYHDADTSFQPADVFHDSADVFHDSADVFHDSNDYNYQLSSVDNMADDIATADCA